MANFLLARQPIFNKSMGVEGYELLYRTIESLQHSVIRDPNQATGEMLVNLLLGNDLPALVGNHKAYINITLAFLMGDYPLPVENDKLVMELPETLEYTPVVIEAIIAHAAKGYQFAIDDVVDPNLIPVEVLPHIRVMKLDLTQIDDFDLPGMINSLRWNTHFRGQILIEKIETPDQYALCKKLGADLFQGFFLSRPNLIEGKRIESNRATLLRAIQLVHDPNLDFGVLERWISQDVTLSYKLLRLVNSAFFGLPTKVDSIRQALMILGVNQLRTWLTLLLFSTYTHKPPELVQLALLRGRMASLTARMLGDNRQDTYFLAGMLSTLDALTDQSMEKALADLPLTSEMQAAILQGEGKIGLTLSAVMAYEKAAWDAPALKKFDSLALRNAYLDAVMWSNQINNIQVLSAAQ